MLLMHILGINLARRQTNPITKYFITFDITTTDHRNGVGVPLNANIEAAVTDFAPWSSRAHHSNTRQTKKY